MARVNIIESSKRSNRAVSSGPRASLPYRAFSRPISARHPQSQLRGAARIRAATADARDEHDQQLVPLTAASIRRRHRVVHSIIHSFIHSQRGLPQTAIPRRCQCVTPNSRSCRQWSTATRHRPAWGPLCPSLDIAPAAAIRSSNRRRTAWQGYRPVRAPRDLSQTIPSASRCTPCRSARRRSPRWRMSPRAGSKQRPRQGIRRRCPPAVRRSARG
jgi:hypothetical protein